MHNAISITLGAKFSRLTVVSGPISKKGHRMYECLCDCGNKKFIRGSALVSKNTLSCGCLNNELAATLGKKAAKHGMTKSSEYISYQHMMGRCYRKTNAKFKDYGERGIRVCDRWRNSFEAFLSDMGKKPGVGYSIGRIDNDGNYEPGNCRWETAQAQGSNKRNTVRLNSCEVSTHQAGLARDLGVTPKAIEYHIKKGHNATQIINHFQK